MIRTGLLLSECSDGAGLLALRDKSLDPAFANDPDYDRHGIVTYACWQADEPETTSGGRH